MIGTYNESFLHYTLKEMYALEGKTEQSIGGYVCDVVQDNGSIVEIQTRNLSKLKEKLKKLLPDYRVTVVHPIAGQTIIQTIDMQGNIVSRRKSPKKGTIFNIFDELTGVYPLLLHPNFSLEVLSVTQTEIRRKTEELLPAGRQKRGWRNKTYTIEDRILDTAGESHIFACARDYLNLIPPALNGEFTVKELCASGAGKHAGKMCWVLCKMNLLKITGKRGRAFVYKKA